MNNRIKRTSQTLHHLCSLCGNNRGVQEDKSGVVVSSSNTLVEQEDETYMY